jgi:hypothetical protein
VGLVLVPGGPCIRVELLPTPRVHSAPNQRELGVVLTSMNKAPDPNVFGIKMWGGLLLREGERLCLCNAGKGVRVNDVK